MDKQEEIDETIKKLNKIFENIPDNKKELVEGLIQNAAFMEVTLMELQNEVIDKGAMISYKSGNGFDTIRDNPAQKAYTTMISRYSQVINQLQTLLPDSKSDNINRAGDNLAKFVMGGKPVELR